MEILLFIAVVVIIILSVKYPRYQISQSNKFIQKNTKESNSKPAVKYVKGIIGILVLFYLAWSSASLSWPAMAEIIKVKYYGVETIATVVECIPEQRQAKHSFIVYKHIVVYDGYTRKLLLDHEYPIGSQISVRYLTQDPFFSVMLSDKRLSIWDQLNLRVMDTTNGNAGTFNFVITIIFFLMICFLIVWFYRSPKIKRVLRK